MTRHHGPRTGRPPARASRGMISSAHDLASTTGLQVLREGGSAVDAAIAAGAVLCVTSPHANGLGGDACWLVCTPGNGEVNGLVATGPAAQRATRAYYGGRGAEGAIPARGAAAALTVPGVVDGWREAHERFGVLRWDRLFDDAIHHAAAGVPVSRSLADATVRSLRIFSRHHCAARFFTPGGRRIREGERLVQEELAASLERIAHMGPRTFYEGELAERICAALEPEGSPLRPADFRNFRAEWVRPLSVTYRGYTAWELPPASRGLAVLQLLGLVEDFDLSGWGDGTAAYIHHVTEAARLAMADTDAWISDPVFVDIPVDEFLSDSYLNGRKTRIRAKRAMSEGDVRPGLPFGEEARRGDAAGHGEVGERGAPASGQSPGGDRPRGDGGGRSDGEGPGGEGSTAGPGGGPAPSGDTCSLVVVDRDGLTVAVVQSIHDDFGCGEVAGGTGILLGNQGATFSLDGGRANRLEPGKRPAHALVPGLLTRKKKPRIAFGTMGGRGQP
jgi:gamma-glutamyltranspeptidase